jgi:hypothetical protein
VAAQFGFFLIADITGYTQYLSASELDHAEKVLSALLNLLIDHTRPPLIISRLAGDAVISYGLADRFVEGQTFVEMLEDTYLSFRQQIEVMVRNTTCPCNACRNIGSLDLKFFLHFGEFKVQKLGGHDELVGSDVNLIHRLLKNSVTETLGLRAYTLYTDAAIERLGLGEEAGRLIPHRESYEHLGEVGVHIQDMHPIWEARRNEVQVRVPPAEEFVRFETVIHASPELVWNSIVEPGQFNVLLGGDRGEVTGRKAGRVAPGSVYQCYHGDAVISNTVLGWTPFEQMTVEFLMPIPIPDVVVRCEVQLIPVPEGTRLVEIYSRSRGSLLGRVAGDAAMRARAGHARDLIENFKQLVEHKAGAITAGGSPSAVSAAEISGAVRASLAGG